MNKLLEKFKWILKCWNLCSSKSWLKFNKSYKMAGDRGITMEVPWRPTRSYNNLDSINEFDALNINIMHLDIICVSRITQTELDIPSNQTQDQRLRRPSCWQFHHCCFSSAKKLRSISSISIFPCQNNLFVFRQSYLSSFLPSYLVNATFSLWFTQPFSR